MEAVIAGITYWLFKPKLFQNKAGANNLIYYENYYHDRLREAIGDDMMPSTPQDWARTAALWKMSRRDIMLYSDDRRCFCALPDSTNEYSDSTTIGVEGVYFWQFEDLITDITFAPSIDQDWLDLKNYAPIEDFLNGEVVSYATTGRIGFAINNITEDKYNIYDILSSDITALVFDKYYDSVNQRQIYISKLYYTVSNIYFKLIEN
jgi:hypothetical protein